MTDVAHSGTSITGGHTNAVAAGAAGFMTGADKTKLDGVAVGADVTGSNAPQAHAASHKGGGSDVIADATATLAGLMPAADFAKLAVTGVINARVVTTVALPAYTVAGTGAGATLTANANGAFPATDGVTLVVNDLVLLQNGASFADNGLHNLTTVGDGSNPWVLTKSTLGDTQAKILANDIKITEGTQGRGAVYAYVNNPTITMGTTALAWMRIDAARGPNEYYSASTDFDQQVAAIANNGVMAGPFGGFFTMAAGAAITVVASPAGAFGVFRFSSTSSVAAVSLAATTNAPIAWLTNNYYNIEFKITGPSALSDGTNTFRMMVGLLNQANVTMTDGVCLEHTHTVDATHWLATTRASSASTNTAGLVISAGAVIRGRIWKYAGETTVHFSIGDTEIGTGNTANQPTGVQLTPVLVISTTAGGAARTFDADAFKVEVGIPNRRAA